MEPKTQGLLEVIAGVFIYKMIAERPHMTVLGGPEKAAGVAASALVTADGFEKLGCSKGASWGAVLGLVMAHEYFKSHSSVAHIFAGQGLSPLPLPRRSAHATDALCQACRSACAPAAPVTYAPIQDFGPGF